jgi:MYXO-CTERM domain-containing protein
VYLQVAVETVKPVSKAVLVVSFALAALWLAPERARACSCLAQDAATAFEGAASVFEGRVVSIEPAGEMQLEVRIRVVRTWKGADAEEVTVTTPAQSAGCGYGFEVDHHYLVYSDAGEEHESVSLCSNTKPIEQAEAELADLGPGATPVDPGNGLGAAEPGEQAEEAPARGGCASCSTADPSSLLVLLLVGFAATFRRRR